MNRLIKFFIFFLLLFNCSAFCLQVPDFEYQSYIQSTLEAKRNFTEQVNNAIKDVELNDDEFILLYGKFSSNKELKDYQIQSLNISDEKADLIVQKLHKSGLIYNYIPNIYKPDLIYDEFTLYISSRPEYYKNKGYVVLFYLTNENEKLKNKDDINNKMDDYRTLLHYRFRPEFYKIKKEFDVQDNKKLNIYLLIDKNGNLIYSDIINSVNESVDNKLLSLIKQSSPFMELPSQYDSPVYSTILSFSSYSEISDSIKNNINSFSLGSYTDASFKIILDKRGNVISVQTVKGSGNDLSDKEIISAIKKTNFVNCIRFSNEERERYVNIRSVLTNSNDWKFDVNIQEIDKQNDESLINWTPYLMQVENQAKANWIPPEPIKSHKIVVQVVLNKEGQIVSKSILESSGNKEADDAVLISIDKGAPYPKFPNEAKMNIMPVELTFDCNVHKEIRFTTHTNKDSKPKKQSKYYELIKKTTPNFH